MHVGRNRIFVGNLPPSINETDIKKQFQSYGNVVSIEIKHRKESNENVSPVFAFVSIEETDKNQLHELFQTIGNYNWDGYYVKLELAKESFLERLKREREEANAVVVTPVKTDLIVNPVPVPVITSTSAKKIYSSSSSSSSSSSDSSASDSESESDKKTLRNGLNNINDDELKDLVIKNNKNKNLTNGLTIESVNSTPIHVIKLNRNSLHKSEVNPAGEKRLNSLYKLKQSYDQQKSLIANALSHIDTKPSNKIVFDDEGRQTNKRKHNFNGKHAKKVNLFQEDDQQQDDDINFDIRQQFEGKQGQRLLELQSKFTNDKRFTLDSRFVEDDDDDDEQNNVVNDHDDEKKKQFEILESVIGKKFNARPQQHQQNNKNIPRGMLRYDPTNLNHSKFEITKQIDDETIEKQVQLDEQPPVEVSKEKFYKVTDNLQQTFKESQGGGGGGFSLLSMFGRNEEQKQSEPEPMHEEEALTTNLNNFDNHNPFRYDSSDSEVEDVKQKKVQVKKPKQRNISGEKFFFQREDERLIDGLGFLKKFAGYTQESTKFMETRRELKQIIRMKLRNVQRNNRPFRKKIGQQHKHIKMKKAKKN